MADVARAIADLRRQRTAGTVGFYAVLAALALLLISVPVCRPVQGQLVRAHQLRPSSLASWVTFQLTPKMYSFAHQSWFSAEPLTEYMLSRDGASGVEHQMIWVNHYPIRAARFEGARAEIVSRGEDVHVRVRTSYRGRSWIARFVVRVEPGGGLVLEPVDGEP